MSYRATLVLLTTLPLVACGGSNSTPKTPPPAGSTDDGEEMVEESAADSTADEGDDEVTGVPRKCAKSGEDCVPPRQWVARLCNGSYPGVAILMFEKSSPWTRGYMRVESKAVYASGGMSGEGRFKLGEEVVVLSVRRQPEGGMQVTGAGGWDVLRWDGTCATVSEGEMALEPSGRIEAAPVTFRYLDEPIREALRTDEAVTEAYRMRRKHCKGATMGEVTKACEDWDRRLSESVVEAVRHGIDLPVPEKLP